MKTYDIYGNNVVFSFTPASSVKTKKTFKKPLLHTYKSWCFFTALSCSVPIKFIKFCPIYGIIFDTCKKIYLEKDAFTLLDKILMILRKKAATSQLHFIQKVLINGKSVTFTDTGKIISMDFEGI